jgi:Subtilase family
MDSTSSDRLIVRVVDSRFDPIDSATVKIHRGRPEPEEPASEAAEPAEPEAGDPSAGDQPTSSRSRRAKRTAQPDYEKATFTFDVEQGEVTLEVRAEGFGSELVPLRARGGIQEVVVGLRRKGELSYDYGDSRFAFRPDRNRFLLLARGEKVADVVDELIKALQLSGRPVLGADDRDQLSQPEAPDEAFRIVDGSMEQGLQLQKRIQGAGLDARVARILPNRDGPPFGLTADIVVRFTSDIERSEAERIGDQFGLRIEREIRHAGNAFLFVRPGAPDYDLLAAVQALRADPRVVYAEPDLVYFLQADIYTPNDPLYPNVPHLPLINADDAWDRLDNVAIALRGGSPNITIGVVDTQGISPNHPDLTANLTDGTSKLVADVNFAAAPIVAQTAAGCPGDHGTQCAGSATAAFDDNRGIPGVAPNCHLIGARIGSASAAVAMADLYLWVGGFSNGSTAAGFPALPSRPADVISSSFGVTGLALSNTIRDCFDFLTTYGRGGRGILVCWSLGNSGFVDFTSATGGAFRAWPTYEKCIAVGASINTNPTNPIATGGHADPAGNTTNIATAVDRRALYSPFGPTMLRKPDLVAPSHTSYGGGPAFALIDPITSTSRVGLGAIDGCAGATTCNDYAATFGGTSHATPVVAGAIGLILSAKSDLSWIQVRDVLRRTSAKIDAGQTNASGVWQDLDGDGAIDYSQWYGFGRLDVDAAVAAVLVPTLNLADVYVRENLGDVGTVPSPGWWAESPDIWVRTTNDPIPALAWTSAPPHVNAVRSHDCFVFARARNRGTAASSAIYLRALLTHYPGFEFRYPQEWQPTTRVGATLPAPITPGTYLIGEKRIDNLAVGADQIVKFTWPQALIPPELVMVSGVNVRWHPCLLLEVSPHDGPSPAGGVIAVRSDNNLAQRNITIEETDSDSDAFVGMVAGTLDSIGIASLVVDTTHLRGRPIIRLFVADDLVMSRLITAVRELEKELESSGGGEPGAGEHGEGGQRGCGCRVTVTKESHLRIDCCGSSLEMTSPAGTVLRWGEPGGGDGGVSVGIGKEGENQVAEIRGLRGRLEIPLALAGGELVAMAAAVSGAASGELRLTQRRGDDQLSPGYTVRVG